MRGILAAAVLALVPTMAAADTLVDKVNGLTLDGEGRVVHFNGLLIGNDGRVVQLLRPGEKRPRADFAVDGRGRTLIPGLILPRIRLMAQALAAIAPGPGPLPPPRPEDRDLALVTIQPELLSRGVTTVTDMGTTIEDWQTYRRAGDEGRLALRIISYAAGTQAMTLIAGPRPTPWLYDDRLRAVGALIEPTGNEIQLKNWISRAAMDRFQPAVQATEVSRPSVEKAFAELAETYKGDRRWRIELVPPGAVVPAPLAEIGGALDRMAALKAYTLDPAQQAFAEGRLGLLTVGARADFVLLDLDLELAAASELRAVKASETWVGGRKVWGGAAPAPVERGAAEGR